MSTNAELHCLPVCTRCQCCSRYVLLRAAGGGPPALRKRPSTLRICMAPLHPDVRAALAAPQLRSGVHTQET